MATTRLHVPRACLMLVAVALVLGACSGSSAQNDGSGPAASLDGCPTPPADGTYFDEFDETYADLPDTVPDDAVSARICSGGGHTGQVPEDILTTSVDELVEAVNDLPLREDENLGCNDDLGAGYRILFDYEDGSTFLISAHLGGCQSVVVGSREREHPAAPAEEFVRLLRQQRADLPAPRLPARPDALVCDQGFAELFEKLPEPTDINDAILCRAESEEVFVTSSAPIPRSDLQLLLRDLDAHRTTGTAQCRLREPHPWMVASTAWGDRVAIYSECGTGRWRLPDGKAWTPGSKAVAILDRLVSEARRVP